MTAFQQLVDRLATWLTTANAWDRIEVSGSKEAALRAVGSGPALVVALADASHSRHETLVSALVRQAQRSPAPAWSAALVVACRDWLERVARRFEAEVASQEDGDSMVVVAFLNVICRLRPRRRVTSAWLKVQTQRQVIAWLRGRGALEGGRPDEPHKGRRLPAGRARVRARRLADRSAGGRS